VRGFVEWNPRGTTVALLLLVQQVLTEYADYLPLTIRQIFYRLVGSHGYEKTEQAYERLGEMINRARRARRIDMEHIRDDTGVMLRSRCWDSAEEFLDVVRANAEQFRLDRQIGQRKRLLLVCEAAGMAPQLKRVTDPFGIPVRSGGGFDSTTDRHAMALEIAGYDVPCEMLHIGDLDQSGAHLCLAWIEDVEAFALEYGGAVKLSRLP
jgi:hypothetical protein